VLPDDVVVRVVSDRIRAYGPISDDRRRASVVRHNPVERDRRPGFRAENRDVAPLGALDDDIRFGRTLKILVGDVRDLARDRIPDLGRPVCAIERVACVR
jgi:hypothetical protein